MMPLYFVIRTTCYSKSRESSMFLSSRLEYRRHAVSRIGGGHTQHIYDGISWAINPAK